MNNDDDIFKRAYERGEEEPSPGLWNELSKRLDDKKTNKNFSKQNSLAYGASLLLLLLFGLLICNKKSGVKNNSQAISVVANSHRKANTGAASAQLEAEQQRKNITKKWEDDKQLPNAAAIAVSNRVTKQKNGAGCVYFIKSGVAAQSSATVEKKARQNKLAATLPAAPNDTTEVQTSLLPNTNSSFINSLPAVQIAIAERHDSARLMNALVAALPTDSVTEAKHETIKKDHLIAKTKNPFGRSWNLLPFATADFIHSTLDADDAFPNNNAPEENEGEEKENHQFCFSAGALFALRGIRKAGITTGLVYSNVAISISPQTLYARTDGNQHIAYKFATSSGYAFLTPGFNPAPAAGDSIRSAGSEVHLHYLSVPFLVNYTLPAGKRFSIVAGTGMMASLLTSAKGKTELSNAASEQSFTISKLQGLKPLSVSFLANAEMDYHINRRFHFALLSQLQLPLSKMTKYKAPDAHQYSFSAGAGVVWTLR